MPDLSQARPDRFARKRRQGFELACELVFRPLAHPLVLVLARLRVPPVGVVLSAFATGLVAAVAIGRGELALAALLLQAKTLLDNADGQLARFTNRTSALGRYLDSESDLALNAVLCATIGLAAGQPILGIVAFFALTTVLSLNYNVERLYRRERGEPAGSMPEPEGPVAAVLARVYAFVYFPQDRYAERFCEWRLRDATPEGRLAYHDRFTVSVMANLGLSTQLALLGACLLAGSPTLYLGLSIASLAVVVPLALRRELLLRRSAQPAVQIVS